MIFSLMYSRDNFCMESEGEMYILKYILPYMIIYVIMIRIVLEQQLSLLQPLNLKN